MPLYTEVHSVDGGVTFKDVGKAHQAYLPRSATTSAICALTVLERDLRTLAGMISVDGGHDDNSGDGQRKGPMRPGGHYQREPQ
jgi:hypothetical protein